MVMRRHENGPIVAFKIDELVDHEIALTLKSGVNFFGRLIFCSDNMLFLKKSSGSERVREGELVRIERSEVAATTVHESVLAKLLAQQGEC